MYLSPSLIRQLAVLLTITLLFQSYIAVAMPFCSQSSLVNPIVQDSGHHHGDCHQTISHLKLVCDNCKLCSVCNHIYDSIIPILPFPLLSTAVNYLFLAIFFISFIPEQLQRPPNQVTSFE